MTGPLAEALLAARVLVCVGPGGVGKTTVSAALALRAAASGRSSMVCTIDPARRLANALGLSELGNAEARISEATLRGAGVPVDAPLYAMMLDMKQTWDELIERYAPPDKREQILQSRFYQALSTALAGSQEYIAIEKLWQLRSRRDYELIVLDTPPTAHALDFLNAPDRVLDFLDNEAARWLLGPALTAGKLGLKLFNLGGSYVLKQLSRFTGTETLQQLAEFMSNLSGLNERFRERAQQVKELLVDPSSAFVLVTGPGALRVDEAIRFHTLLLQHEMKVAAVVVNRVHPPVSARARAQAQGLSGQLKGKVEATLSEAEAVAAEDARGLEELRRGCEGTPLIQVPRFELDVHDLNALYTTSRFLVGEASMAEAEPVAG